MLKPARCDTMRAIEPGDNPAAPATFIMSSAYAVHEYTLTNGMPASGALGALNPMHAPS